ncbi:MAG: hypothetical protein IJB86_07015 [Clostridia bacterium]|nr:hypothetical protein [Clostridia bacterium]
MFEFLLTVAVVFLLFFLLICVITFAIIGISIKLDNKKRVAFVKKYREQIMHYAYVYTELEEMCEGVGTSYSSVVLLCGKQYGSHDSYFYDNTSFFKVKIGLYRPLYVEKHYSGTYDFSKQYNEEEWKKHCLGSLLYENEKKLYPHLDEKFIWDCILDEILEHKNLYWSGSEWFFHYPILLPDSLSKKEKEFFTSEISAEKEKISQLKDNAIGKKQQIGASQSKNKVET